MNANPIKSYPEPSQLEWDYAFTDVNVIHLLRSNGIRAILWKGRPLNTTVAAIDGDIDVLVHSEDKDRAEAILHQYGFRNVPNSYWRNQPHVHDWYCIDNANLVHIQLYDLLVLGSYASAQLLVPNQNILFDSSTEYSSDAVAAVLRICRATLYSPFHPGKKPKHLINEAKQLIHTTDAISKTASELFDDQAAIKIIRAYQTGEIKDLKDDLNNRFRSPTPAGGIGFKAHVLKYVSNINRRTLRLPILTRRTLNKPAPIIALIGSDGSGKSTAATVSSRRINKKIDTKFIYFGTGDGSSSVLRLPLIFLKHIREKARKKNNKKITKISNQQKTPVHNNVPSIAKAAWAIAVALERRSKMRQAKKFASAGIIVITDRYPQNEQGGIHDGPRLFAWLSANKKEKNKIKHKLAKWEQGIYDSLSTAHPDLLILLDVDLETAIARRPDELREDLKRRIEVARQLRYANAHKVIINAADPIDMVHNNAMNAILEAAVGEV